MCDLEIYHGIMARLDPSESFVVNSAWESNIFDWLDEHSKAPPQTEVKKPKSSSLSKFEIISGIWRAVSDRRCGRIISESPHGITSGTPMQAAASYSSAKGTSRRGIIIATALVLILLVSFFASSLVISLSHAEILRITPGTESSSAKSLESGENRNNINITTISSSEKTSEVVSSSSPSTSEFWYAGASTTNPLSESNNGIRAWIQVKNQSVSEGVLSFWISEAFGNNSSLWAQVGYYVQNNSELPTAFYQVWNLSLRQELTSETETISSGIHLFSIALLSDTTSSWDFAVDGKSIGVYNMLSNSSSSSYPIYAMSEEGYVTNTFSFEPVLFQTAIQFLKMGTSIPWQNVPSANSFGNSWGIQGNDQNASLGIDEITIGGASSVLTPNSDLWN